ncbi:uncharacterized protein [Coffea arabica]|uniref:Transmembrane protein n=1 Tax=Coffea arabica TaxID=13443 RepID=A0ABM4UA16_COFAR
MAEYEPAFIDDVSVPVPHEPAIIDDVSVPVPLELEGVVDDAEAGETRMNSSGHGRTKGSGQASKKENENGQAILPWVIFGAMALGVAAAATICGAVIFTKKSGETLESADKLFKSLTALAKKWAAAPPADVHIDKVFDKVFVNVDYTWYKRG